MEITYAYRKLMEKQKLSESDLSGDAKHGISAIKKIEKAIAMLEAKGKKPTANVIEKLKANDRWVTREILDQIEDKNSGQSTSEPDNNAQEAVDEIKAAEEKARLEKEKADKEKADAIKKEEADNADKKKLEDEKNQAAKVDENAVTIDKEIKALIEAGSTSLIASDLKSKAPKTYAVIFDNYEKGAENGVETSYYRAVEVEAEKFELSKL